VAHPQGLKSAGIHFDRSNNEAKRREYLLKAGEAAQALRESRSHQLLRMIVALVTKERADSRDAQAGRVRSWLANSKRR